MTSEALVERAGRTQLLDGQIGLVETVWNAGVCRQKGTEDFSPEFQIALPYRGIFVWHVGRDDVVGDANQVLFVTGGEGFQISGPLPGGYEELVITPDLSVLCEIANVSEADLQRHPLFRERRRRADPRLQSLRAHFLSWASGAPDLDDLGAEELVLALLRAALDGDAPRGEPGASTRRLIRRTKEYVEAELANPIRLPDVGRAVGASPAYLTDVFRRIEGVPLHRYVTQLRLARALAELHRADDLTTLALGVGFSSHSHFTAVFRRAFGFTPSRFRAAARSRLRPPPVEPTA